MKTSNLEIFQPVSDRHVQVWADASKAHASAECDTQALIRDLQERVYNLEKIVALLRARKAAWAGTDSPRPISASQIIKAVAEWEGVSEKHIRGPSRLRRVARARFIAVYIIREVIGMSLQDIASQFSYKDHGSALHGIRQVEEEMTVDSSLKRAVMGYIEKLKTPPQP